MAKYQVQGVEALLGKLQSLRKRDLKRGIAKGSRAGAKIVQARAKDLVPVKTGALKREIKVRAMKRSRRFSGTMVTTKVAGGPTYYGGFVELGTRKMEGRRFLRDAAEEVKDTAGAAFVDGIKTEIDRVFGH